MNSAPYEGNGWYSQSGYIVPSETVREFASYADYIEWLESHSREN